MQYAIWSLLVLALIAAAVFSAKMWGKYQQSDKEKQEAYAKSRREWAKVTKIHANRPLSGADAIDRLRSEGKVK